MADPLIVTLRLDAATFDRLDALRQAHFPDRGFRLPAHLTLFHALPGNEAAGVHQALDDVAAVTPPFPVAFTEVVDLRPGAAFRAASPVLTALRTLLAERWAGWLTRQDAAGCRPHVTVQNKVQKADSVYPALAASFDPFQGAGTGLLLWHYRGGPWAPAGSYPFAGKAAATVQGNMSDR